ncbi:hypothetical protein C8K63_101477 [Pseudomonas sp. GV085]|nr:hypothetical protein C8K63_101477 [Pseudomonas sp. GV085]
MVVNDNAYLLAKRGALESIASKLAPTGTTALRRQAVFLCPDFRQKKASDQAGLRFLAESGRVGGHFSVMGDQRNQGVLLSVGELAEAL